MSAKKVQESAVNSSPSKKRRKKWNIESWELVPREIEATRKKRLLADLGRLIYSSLQSSQLSQNLNSASLGIESQNPEVSGARIQDEERK